VVLSADTDDWYQIPTAKRSSALLIRHGSPEPFPQ
jgi:hypothetical protein